MKINKIYNIDCLVGMKRLQPNSIDLMVTDPPYGLSFMGKDWDKAVPSVEIWKECFRVLKDGAFAFIMSSPRLDVLSQMVMRLEKAGFKINFTPIYWAYASGFPKAGNIGKMVDKKYGRIGCDLSTIKLKLKNLYEASGKTFSQIDKDCGFRASGYLRIEHRDDDGWGESLPTVEKWKVIKKVINCKNNQMDKYFREAEREIIGRGSAKFFEKNEVFDLNKESYGDFNLTISKTKEGKALNGSYAGFQPKPAVEVIIVAMKPLSEKTYVEQALKNGKGITWLDGCRIPHKEDNVQAQSGHKGQPFGERNHQFTPREYTTQGRFPANLLVSGDVLNDGSTHKSGKMDGVQGGFGNSEIYGNSEKAEAISYSDSGSFSRYFSLDAWWQGLIKKLPKDVQKVFPFLIVPKASKSEKNDGLEKFNGKYMDESRMPGSLGGTNPRNRGAESQRKNFHPTVKPLQLISYLITLGSRENEIILDPFIGSGTTAISARIFTRNFIGFEISKDYHKIAEARLKPYLEQQKLNLGGFENDCSE